MTYQRRQPLEEWLLEAVTDEENQGAPCTALSVVHKNSQGQDEEIFTLKLNSGKQWTSKELEQLIFRKSTSYCQDLSGVQTCLLLAFYGERSEPGMKHPFTVSGKSDFEGATEAPEPRGQVAQGMRHIEVMFQTHVKQFGMMLEHQNTLFKNVSEQNVRLNNELADAYRIVRDVTQKEDDRRHEHRIKELEYKRSSEERKKWLSFGPALVNSLFGREIFPQSSADTALVESIAEALTIEDIQKISQLLPPHLWGPMASRIEKYMKEKRESEETALQLASGMDGEQDAAGDVEKH